MEGLLKSASDANATNDPRGASRVLREYLTLLVRISGILASALDGPKEHQASPCIPVIQEMFAEIGKNTK